MIYNVHLKGVRFIFIYIISLYKIQFMKSLKNYSNEQNIYFTSLQSRVENEPAVTFENLVSSHGSNIDSVLHKMRLHNYRLANPNYIHESIQDVRFDISEQYAARDIILTVCEQYEYALLHEFCAENGIDVQIDEAFGSVKSFIANPSFKLHIDTAVINTITINNHCTQFFNTLLFIFFIPFFFNYIYIII